MRPRVGMHSLPLEVKEMIARCCYEQDEALRIAVGRNADGTYPDGARSEVAFACCPVATNTLGTLFCLSTEWAEIAAPFRFATLTVQKILQPNFQEVVLPRRAQRFTRFIVREAYKTPDADSFKKIASLGTILRNLPNLKRLVTCDPRLLHIRKISPYGFELPGSSNVESIQAERVAREALDECIENVVGLELQLDTLEQAIQVLPEYPNERLRSLSLSNRDIHEEWPQVLALAPNLASLTITLSDFGRQYTQLSQPRFLRVSGARSSAPVQHLAIRLRTLLDLGPALLRFIEYFSSTLVNLDIRSVKDNEADNLAAFIGGCSGGSKTGIETGTKAFEATFPHLHSMTLGGKAGHFAALLRSVTAERFPKLQQVACRGFYKSEDSLSLHLDCRVKRVPRTRLERVVERLADPDRYDVELDCSDEEDLENEPTDEEALDPAGQLRRTLDFVTSQVQQALAYGTPESMKELSEQLEVFEMQRKLLQGWKNLSWT